MTNNDSVKTLMDAVRAFCEERDWDQFHTPKELAIGISTEANELLEIFRFMTDEQQAALLRDAKSREHIEDELADTAFFVLRFAQMNGIDLGQALERKIAKNAKKYPVETCRGKNQKQSELSEEEIDIAVAKEAHEEYVKSGGKSRPIKALWQELGL